MSWSQEPRSKEIWEQKSGQRGVQRTFEPETWNHSTPLVSGGLDRDSRGTHQFPQADLTGPEIWLCKPVWVHACVLCRSRLDNQTPVESTQRRTSDTLQWLKWGGGSGTLELGPLQPSRGTPTHPPPSLWWPTPALHFVLRHKSHLGEPRGVEERGEFPNPSKLRWCSLPFCTCVFKMQNP